MNNNYFIIDRITDVEKCLDDMEAVIFDLDDTLYSEKEYVRSGYHKIAEHFGIPELEDSLWTVFENGGMAIDEVFEKIGMVANKDEALKVYRFQKPDIHLYNGVSELLRRLRPFFKVGIVSDGRPEGQRAKIEALKLEVDEIIITDELGGIEYRKPNPKAFELMQQKMNIPYEKMVYVGDNPQKDFQAPELLNMKCILFNNPDGLYSTK